MHKAQMVPQVNSTNSTIFPIIVLLMLCCDRLFVWIFPYSISSRGSKSCATCSPHYSNNFVYTNFVKRSLLSIQQMFPSNQEVSFSFIYSLRYTQSTLCTKTAQRLFRLVTTHLLFSSSTDSEACSCAASCLPMIKPTWYVKKMYNWKRNWPTKIKGKQRKKSDNQEVKCRSQVNGVNTK